MKLRKSIVIPIIIFLILLAAALFSTVSAASSMKLGITRLREDGYGYKQTQKSVWKIIQSDKSGAEKFAKAIYCVNPNKGFGNAEVVQNDRLYDFSVDMKNITATRASIANSSLPQSDGNYRAMLWLADNIYSPKVSTAALDRTNLMNAVDKYATANSIDFWEDTLNDSDIDVVQQIAFWYFATQAGDPFHNTNIGPHISDYNVDGNYQSLLDKIPGGDGEERNSSMQALYRYLITQAKTNYNPDTNNKSPITLDNTVPVVEINGGTYSVGPYKLTKNNDMPYTLNTKFYDQNNNQITSYSLLDSNKQPTNKTIEEMIGSNFYISIPITTAATKVKITVDTTYSVSEVMVWTSTTNSLTEQPIVVIDKVAKSYHNEINTNIEATEYDFELLKTVSGTANTLDGAKFQVKLVADDNSVLINQVLTTVNGKINIPSINYNGIVTFTIKEVEAPAGFILNDTEYIFKIRFNKLTGQLDLVEKTPSDSDVKVVNGALKVTIDIGNKPIIPIENFDLALRKFITKIEEEIITNRVPEFYIDGNGEYKYKHPKNPLIVKSGDLVEYTIRIYNEGDTAGFAQSIRDHIPEWLEFVPNNATNIKYRWVIQSDSKSITSDYISKEQGEDRGENTLLKPFKEGTMTEPDYRDLKVVFKVTAPDSYKNIITNIAEIAEDADEAGDPIDDIDSIPDNKNEEEDDIDEDHVRLKHFDLALRKFITKIQEEEITNRVPEFYIDENGKYKYRHPKNPLGVRSGDLVEYTIRIYNEGDLAGFAQSVRDHIPEGLEFVLDNETNLKYRWKLDSDLQSLTSDYISKEQGESRGEDTLLKSFDEETMTEPDYRDLKIVFKVTAPNSHPGIITNIAEIAEDADETGDPIDDIDSIPDNGKDEEDDIDEDHIKLGYFDLALRKFITKIQEDEVTSRIPEFYIDEDGKYKYKHPKDPLLVYNNDIVEYTIRIYNEGTIDGYAELVSDDLPDGITFLPDHETNKEYRWKVSEDGKTVVTDYLSKEQGEDNLIKGFDPDTMESPNYKDIKIAFKVTEKKLPPDRIITNTAEITEDADDNGDPIDDIDSDPDNWKDEEDDIDEEHIKVLYFDLALYKWVSRVIINDNGKITETPTGHSWDSIPEPVVKVEIDKNKLGKIIVKFEYTIKIVNEGEIEGYCTEITDYIPEGLEFIQADNPQWVKHDGNKITTDALAGTLLKPGESANVKVLLKWINGENNLGLKVNVAEISKDDNDHDSEDIDSTPDNKIEGEDDIDDAPVMLALKTGSETLYITLTTTVLTMFAVGLILIKRYVIG